MENITLFDFIEQSLTGRKIKELHESLNISNKWLMRKINNPGLFKKEELELLSIELGVTQSQLLDEYGVGKDTITSAEADAIREQSQLIAVGNLSTSK
jgi:hypothetical protein